MCAAFSGGPAAPPAAPPALAALAALGVLVAPAAPAAPAAAAVGVAVPAESAGSLLPQNGWHVGDLCQALAHGRMLCWKTVWKTRISMSLGL